MPETAESSDEEWEEVEESQKNEEDEVKPSESVEVELDLPKALKKKKKKEDWHREMVETSIRRAVKKFNTESQLAMHKVHLLCLLALGMRLNKICNKDELRALVFSLLPEKYANAKPKHISAIFLTRFIQDFVKIFEFNNGIEKLQSCKHVRLPNLENLLVKALEKKTVKFRLDIILIFVLALRAMGFNTRLVISMQPLPLKALTEKQKENAAKTKDVPNRTKKNAPKKRKSSDSSNITIPQFDGPSDSPRPKRMTRSRCKKNSTAEKAMNDAPKPNKCKKQTANKKAKGIENVAPKTVSKEFGKARKNEVANTKRPKNALERETKVLNKVSGGEREESDRRVDETPLLKPFSANQTKRRLPTRSKVKQKIYSDPVLDNESDAGEDFHPIKSSDSEDSDFEVETIKSSNKKRRSTIQRTMNTKSSKSAVKKGPKQATNRKSLPNGAEYYDHWLEVYSEQDCKWMCLDIFRCIVNHPEQMEKWASPNIHYVLGFENEGYLKDLTARYASKWLTETRKLRAGILDKDWWKETLAPYVSPNTQMDTAENREMQAHLLAQPLPTTITAYKNHPLFGLRRHLLKYEAIYPADIPAVGLIRGEEVFPRSSIHTLHTRDKWLQSARVVRDGEEPYKMVASIWINMKLKQDMATLSMPLFGRWQTDTYVPPVAKDGKVPRNQYGNVDLFQPSMMPIGCVQLRLPGLQKIARKLDIDVVAAITGFDTHSGYPHPVTDGYIACKEHEEALVAAWQEDQVHVAERERKKREERVYGHWKFFIKAMLAKERVKKKYASKDKTSASKGDGGTVVSAVSGTAWQAKRLEAAKKKARGRGKAKKDENLFPFEMESM